MIGIRRSFARGAWLVMVPPLLGWLAATGCGTSGGTPPPKTYPVSGKVFYKGGQPLPSGVIQFQSDSEPNLTTKGDIRPDGTFDLVTLFQDEQLLGATEGRYHVTVVPRMTENKPVDVFQLPQLFTVKAEENYFAIELVRTRERQQR